MRQERFGGLQVRIVGGSDGKGGGDGPVVVLLHGFGAPGDDLISLWHVLDAPGGTRFVFPEGPLSLSLGFGESRAWWMIDMERLNRDIAAGRLRDLSRDVPKGLAEARQRLIVLLDEVERRLGANPKKTILGGFSQGAMLSCDVALRTDRPLAALVLMSGTLLAKEEWVPLMPKRKGLRVLQSHGKADPLLPFSLAEQLRDLLSQAGLAVEWVSFRGGHEIPEAVLTRLGNFIRRAVADR
jgi:phospholipase/carboxylesterase